MAFSENIRWRHSLRFQSVLVFGSIMGWLVLAIALAMTTLGRKVVSDQAEQAMVQRGNTTVVNLAVRLQEIEALTRAIAANARTLPPDAAIYQQVIPGLLDFDGDLSVAGGGIWPEPYQFDPEVERASFFWGRSEQGNFEFFDDYNQPGAGYHREAWYVTGSHLQPGVCSWSDSYTDPVSLEPMVTCTVGVFRQQTLQGVATVDLNLGGLQRWAADPQFFDTGYLFVVDRQNRLITLPQVTADQALGTSTPASAARRYPLVADLAEQIPEFVPISDALSRVNAMLLARAQGLPEYEPELAEELAQASYQLELPEAQLLAASILDPLERNLSQNHLLTTVAVPQDPVLGQPSTAFIFHVPGAYWKIIMVRPDTAIAAPASQVMNWLLLCILGATAIAAPMGYWGLKRWLLEPIEDTTDEVQAMSAAIAEQNWAALPKPPPPNRQANEIGLLRRMFATLAQTIATASQQLQTTNRDLRQSLHQLTSTQSQLVQAEKMSSLGQLVAGVAHEINNPVNFIHGNLAHAQDYATDLLHLAEAIEAGASQDEVADLMAEMDFAFVKADLPKLLASMETGTHRIRQIVLSLRNFSRLDEAACKTVNIHEGLESTLTILSHRTKAQPNRPAVEIVKQYGELPLVECYPGPLNQVFMNLLGNALDALEEGDRVSDAVATRHPARLDIVTEVAEGDRVRIHICDNGPGMTPEVQRRIFEYLYTTKAPGKGTGLGLSISRDIIESKHHGQLSVVSTLGQGTTFTITLPIYQHGAESSPAASAAQAMPATPS